MGINSKGNIMVKAIAGILGILILSVFAAPFLMNWATTKTPETVYELNFVAPIRKVKILDGGGFTFSGGRHWLKFSGPEGIVPKDGERYATIPAASEAARKGIELILGIIPADRSLLSDHARIQCSYYGNGHHEESWLVFHRDKSTYYFYSMAN